MVGSIELIQYGDWLVWGGLYGLIQYGVDGLFEGGSDVLVQYMVEWLI